MIIWLASYPKSGNTWLRAILNLILFSTKENTHEWLSNLHKNIDSYPKIRHFSNLNNSLKKQNDFQNKKEIVKNWYHSQNKINKDNKLKFFKTHNMCCSLTIENKTYKFTELDNCLGVIYIVRDPRNIITSLKNHFFFNSYNEAFNMMVDENRWIGITEKEVPQTLSSWDQHYNSWSFFPKNFILFKYEDLLFEPKNQINRLIKYLEKFIDINISEEKINKIIEKTSFSNLQNLEDQGFFNEKSINPETKEEKKFFYLGQRNSYLKLLDDGVRQKIEKKFRITMKNLGYL